ncbi:MAG: hypothetical protein U1E05_22295 [Patescibacteria group bacterium]|nr:hypothetical protein [Patescibacteria group bacterium]
MLNRVLLNVICIATLGGEGLLVASAHAQYPATGGYGGYSPDGIAPGTSQAVPEMPQRPIPTTQPSGWPGSYRGSESPYGGQQASYSQPPAADAMPASHP